MRHLRKLILPAMPHFKEPKRESYFYEIKYEDTIPFIYYWKDTGKLTTTKEKRLILSNADYIFLYDTKEKKSFLSPIWFDVYCSGKDSTFVKADPIIQRVYNVRYSSVLKEGNHEYEFPAENYWNNCLSPWVPDLSKDKNLSVRFNIRNYGYGEMHKNHSCKRIY